MTLQAVFMGVDLSSRVVTYGQAEAVKLVNLASSSLAVSSYSLTVRNEDGAFNPQGPFALVQNRRFEGKELSIVWNGISVFDGWVRDIQPGPATKTAVIQAESKTSGMALAHFTASAQGVNPAEAALGLILSVPWIQAGGLSINFVEAQSFIRASGPARANNATVDYDFKDATLLSALNELADMAGMYFFEYNGKIRAANFVPYPGNSSGLRQTITTSNMREPGAWKWAIDSYYNQVVANYTAGTGTTSVTLDNLQSRKKNSSGRIITRQHGSGSVISHDLVSASYFGGLCLAKVSVPRGTLPVAVGADFLGTVPGMRFPLTYAGGGFLAYPCEAISVKASPDRNEIELELMNLA